MSLPVIGNFLWNKLKNCWGFNMCMILDPDQIVPFVNARQNQDKDLLFIHEWLKDKKGKFVYTLSGKYGEIMEDAPLTFMMKSYFDAGKFRICDAEKYKYAKKIISNWVKKPNPGNVYILALAMAENVKVLHTQNESLKKDFVKYIAEGKIYQNKKKDKNFLDDDTCP